MAPQLKPHNLDKYWNQRYNLFSRYDDGVMLDDEAWWSVTPENIARHIAQRTLQILGDGHLVIVDGFCGVGGNLIQFALYSPRIRVIGCDIDLKRLKMAKHNAEIYGVQDQCDFIHGDFMELMTTLRGQRVDAVFLSPPWGGIQYKNTKRYSLNQMQPNGFEIVRLCREHLTNNIAFLMPRNIDIEEVSKRLLDKHNPELEREKNLVGTKIKTITVYFGELVDQQVESDEGVGGAYDDNFDEEEEEDKLHHPPKKRSTGASGY